MFENEDDVRKYIYELLKEDFRFDYKNHTYVPTMEVAEVASYALNVLQHNKLVKNSGSNEGSGVQKAKSLMNREPHTHSLLKRMKAFFDNNHEEYQLAVQAGKNIFNSEIIQKWSLWGGDPGRIWVERHIKSLHDQNQTSKDLRPKGIKRLMDPTNHRKR